MRGKRFRIGIIGCGAMGKLWAGKIQEEGRGEVAGVSDISDAARVLGERLEVPWYERHDLLLAKGDMDAVVIATPHNTHEEIAVAAARAGKHILLEKAMAIGVKACDAILEAVRVSGVKLMVGHTHRFLPLFAKVRELALSGSLGEPKVMYVTHLNTHPSANWWGRKKECGGMLYWQGCHDFDYMGSILADAISVYATAPGRVNHEADYIDTVSVNIRFRNGREGHFVDSFVSAMTHYDGKILLSEGTILYGSPPVWVRYRRRDGEEHPVSAGEIETMENGFLLELKGFLDYVLEDAPAPVTGEAGRQSVAIIDASYRSIETGKPVLL